MTIETAFDFLLPGAYAALATYSAFTGDWTSAGLLTVFAMQVAALQRVARILRRSRAIREEWIVELNEELREAWDYANRNARWRG